MQDLILRYMKAFLPLAGGILIAVVDKLVLNDDIPDALWLALLGTAPVVAAVPNKEPEPKVPDHAHLEPVVAQEYRP